jgi:hypothetical protein
MQNKFSGAKELINKREYQPPKFVRYGALRELTQTGTTGSPENNNACVSTRVKSGGSCN